MSVTCVTRQTLQTSLVPTNDVVSSTRQTTIGQGGQMTQVAYTTVSCATFAGASSAVVTSCDTRTLTSTMTIPGTQIVSQVVVPVTVSGYATFINTLHETTCTTLALPPTITPPTTTALPTTTTPLLSSDPPGTSSVSPTGYSASVTSGFVPLSSTSRPSRSTVGPNDDPASLSSLAAQNQPSETSNNGVPMAPVVGGVVGGVGGALLLGLLLYFLLFRIKSSAKRYNGNTLPGQAQIDPRHYEYTPVQSNQGYSNGRTSEHGVNVISQPGSQYVNPFSDPHSYYPSSQSTYGTSQDLGYDLENELPTNQVASTGLFNHAGVGVVTGGAFAVTAQAPSSSAGGSPHANSGMPFSLGSVSSTAPMVRRHMPQPSFGSTQAQYRGLAEPADSRF